MSLDKDPLTIHRQEVLDEAQRRRDLREKLRADVQEARTVLSPRYQMRKLVARNKARVRDVIDDTTVKARAAAPVAGVVGLGAAIFFARRPIAKWISYLRNVRKNSAGNSADSD